MEGEVILTGFGTTTLANLAELCQILAIFSEEEAINALNALIGMIGFIQPEQAVPQPIIEEIIQCVLEALDIDTDTNDISGGLATSNINADTSAFDINTSGGQVASFSSPTIAQGTEASSSALEKVEKLKKQWLDLLP